MRLKPYPKYKPSGVEWLGDVPAHWDVKRLKRDLSVLTERSERRSNPVGLENIEGWSGRFIPTATEFEGEGIAFEAGDILFGKLRPYLAKVFLAPSSGEAVGDFHVLHPSANVDGRYATYAMLTKEFISIVDGSTFGAKMPRAGWDFMGSMFWCLPSDIEQFAITSFLDRETAKIDTLIAKQEKLIELLQEKRQAVFSHAVTKGLDLTVPMKPSGIEWLGDVPETWAVCQIKRVLSSSDYGISASLEPTGEIPILRMGNIVDGQVSMADLKFTDTLADELTLAPEDILFNRTNSLALVGKVGMYKGSDYERVGFASYLVRLRANSKAFPAYLAQLFNSDFVLQRARADSIPAIGQANLNPTRYGMVTIPVPPVDEQLAIVSYLDNEAAKIDTLIAKARQAIELQKEHRTALISAAVTGKIDVRGLVDQEEYGEEAA